MKKTKTIARRITGRLLILTLVLVVCASLFFYHFTLKTVIELYAENFHTKMLINYEYTRRVLSDVYVSVTNNVYYIEHTLDKPEEQKDVMERIVRHGTRVHSCGMNFIKDFYPQKGHRYCPFAWRNPYNPDEILTEIKGDHDYDYLDDRWFREVIEGDTAKWSEPFYDGYDNKTALAAYMVPIHDAEGRPVAVLGADVSLGWLTKKLAETDSAYNARSSFATKVLGLKSESFIINHDGTFITHPEGEHLIKGVFYKLIKPRGNSDIERLVEKMKAGQMSENESDARYLFNGQESYLFYTPVKYTDWMMVSIVPCNSIDMLAITYGIEIIAIAFLAMLLLVLICHYFLIRLHVGQQ